MKLILKDTDGMLHVVADSAIARSGQPWFLPDRGKDWRWRPALALRISRLGKGVALKYAPRYFDAVTMLWVAEADNCPDLDFMDGRVVCGHWIPSEESSSISLDNLLRILSEASYAATLKTGDIIAAIMPGDALPIEPDTTASVSLGGIETVKFNIK